MLTMQIDEPLRHRLQARQGHPAPLEPSATSPRGGDLAGEDQLPSLGVYLDPREHLTEVVGLQLEARLHPRGVGAGANHPRPHSISEKKLESTNQ